MTDDTTVAGMRLVHDGRANGVELPIEAWAGRVVGLTIAVPEAGPDAGVMTLMLLIQLPAEAGIVFAALSDALLDQLPVSRRLRDEQRELRRKAMS